MESKITYHQQVSYCGKPRCRKCREGVGHGPYWYAYRTVNGRTTRTYVGKHLPPNVQATLEAAAVSAVDTLPVPAGLTADLTTASVRISALGQFRLERRTGRDAEWQAVTDAAWQQQRVRALLAYLICSPGRKISRAQAMEALSSNPPTAMKAAEGATAGINSNILHRALHDLRQILGHQRGRSAQEGPLRTEGEWITLADQAHVWVDADAFEQLLRVDVEAAPAPSDLADQVDAAQRELLLKNAAALYGGDFLPEERHAEWVIARRQALRRTWIGLLLDLADIYVEQGVLPSAIDVLDRLLANDPANEAAVQRLIVVLAQLKRRGEALRAYHRFTEVLQREYKAMPSAEIQALYEIVRQGGTPVVGASAALSSSSASLPAQANALALPEARHLAGAEPASPYIETPVHVIETLTPAQIGRSHRSPLVGRALELEILHSMLLDVEQNARMQLVNQRRASGIPFDTQRRPQCMVLTGEAGIGKTRLAEEMSREAQQRGWAVVWGRVNPQESGIPYRLWTDALRKVLDLGGGLAPALRIPLLTPAQEMQLLPLTALLPELGELLPQAGLMGQDILSGTRGSTGREPGGRGQAPPLRVQQEQLHLWEATCELLTTISESTPLLIVLDDIQWADGSSCQLLGYLARHLYGHPVLLLGTCRDTELPTQPPHPLRTLMAHMQREHTIRTLNIEPLTREEIRQLVSHLPEPMVQHIQAQAAGNPFFAEELARTTPPTVPKTVAAALDHRMDRLSSACRQLLGKAAVLGGSFEFPMIYAMESGGALADEDTVLDLLEEALQSGVLTDEGTGTRITYHFWHPLLVNHLYDGVSATRRARLHRRAADVLQRMYQGREEEVAAMITHHLVKGGAEPEQIAYYAELAGDQAYALSGYAGADTLSGYAEAEHYYGLALEQMELMPAANEQAHQARLMYLIERLAECTMIRGNFEEARRLYERVLALRCNQSVPGSSRYEAQIQALLWGEIGWTWRYTGDSERGRECCKRGQQTLREAGVISGPAWARLLHQEGNLYLLDGRYEEGRHAAQEALALFEQQQKSATGPLGTTSTTDTSTRTTRIQRTLEGDPVDLGQTYKLLGALANGEGRYSDALTHLSTALAIFEQCDHKRRIAHVSCDLGYIYLKKAKYELAQAALRRSLSLAERLGDDPLAAVVFSNLGELAAASGDLEEAEGWYRRALAQAESSNDREYMSRWNTGLAAVLLEQEKLEEAAACIRRALSIGRAMRNNPCIGGALVALSNLRIFQASGAGKLDLLPRVRTRLLMHARQDVERAFALAGLEAETRVRGQLALAQISFLLGETEKAHDLLANVVEEAHRRELTALEARAKQLFKSGVE